MKYMTNKKITVKEKVVLDYCESFSDARFTDSNKKKMVIKNMVNEIEDTEMIDLLYNNMNEFLRNRLTLEQKISLVDNVINGNFYLIDLSGYTSSLDKFIKVHSNFLAFYDDNFYYIHTDVFKFVLGTNMLTNKEKLDMKTRGVLIPGKNGFITDKLSSDKCRKTVKGKFYVFDRHLASQYFKHFENKLGLIKTIRHN